MFTFEIVNPQYSKRFLKIDIVDPSHIKNNMKNVTYREKNLMLIKKKNNVLK